MMESDELINTINHAILMEMVFDVKSGEKIGITDIVLDKPNAKLVYEALGKFLFG